MKKTMKNIKAILIGSMLSLVGCGSPDETLFTSPDGGVELGQTAQALFSAIPDWYGFGQKAGGGALRARYECEPTDQSSPCYVPNGKKIWTSLPFPSDPNPPPALGGFSSQWWQTRYSEALTQVKTIAQPLGFSFGTCTVIATAGFPFPDNGSVYCKQRKEQGGMWLRIRSREISGPNSTLDKFGWPVPEKWTQGQGVKYRHMSECQAQGKPNGIVTAAQWNVPAGMGPGVDTVGTREQFAENVIASQIWQCLGLGTFPSQGTFQQLLQAPLDVQFGLANERDSTGDFSNAYRQPDYWQRAQNILNFERDLLQAAH